MGLANQVKHHIQRRRASRTGDAGIINFKQLRSHLQQREFLSQPVYILPMDGAGPVIQKPRRRHDIGTGANRPGNRAAAIQPAHQIQQALIGIFLHIKS